MAPREAFTSALLYYMGVIRKVSPGDTGDRGVKCDLVCRRQEMVGAQEWGTRAPCCSGRHGLCSEAGPILFLAVSALELPHPDYPYRSRDLG